jgi:hypothetical protein
MRCGALLVTAVAAGALATAPSPTHAAGPACAAAPASVAHVQLSAGTRRAVAAYKAAHDTRRRTARAAAAPTRARVRRPRPGVRPTCAAGPSGTVVLANLNQQGQYTDYYCGPATVSEMATTRGTPVDQNTSAGWMGTVPNAGTSVDQLVGGLNHFVGDPGGGSYAFVYLSYYPTAGEQTAFVSNLSSDLTTYGGWPVAGDAWEVPGGPHLVGHPDIEIFHWIEVGGVGEAGAAIYYADSATTVWSGVPAYSWIDTGSLVSILGGRGYAW